MADPKRPTPETHVLIRYWPRLASARCPPMHLALPKDGPAPNDREYRWEVVRDEITLSERGWTAQPRGVRFAVREEGWDG